MYIYKKKNVNHCKFFKFIANLSKVYKIGKSFLEIEYTTEVGNVKMIKS